MLTRKTGYLTPKAGNVPEASVQLQTLGYAVCRNILSASEQSALAREIDDVYHRYPPDERGVGVRSPELDEEFRYEMLNRSPECQRLAGHTKILQVIEPLLGEDCHVIANTCWRNPPKGGGAEANDVKHGGGFWHIDAGPHVPREEGVDWPEAIPYPVFAIGVHVYLQDCPIESGPTGVIPRSHTSGQPPPASRYNDPDLRWKGEGVTPLTANAGDVALFVSDVWHRRLPTLEGDQGRFFVQFHYGRRDIAQRLRPTALSHQLSEEAAARVATRREATLLGLHDPRFYDG